MRGILLGGAITAVFTGANLSMGLRTGVTFSSSIPAAILAMATLRTFGGSILESNLVQTQASAAGTLCNVILVLPALVIAGLWQGFPLWQTTAICLLGGLLGVLYSVPLRRAMVGDNTLPFPEGVAAAEVLRVGYAGAEGRSGLRDLATGGLAAGAIALLTGLGVLGGAFTGTLAAGPVAWRAGIAFSPALVGVGYLVGIGCGAALLTGLAIAWGIAVPLLASRSGLPAADAHAAAALAQNLWSSQVRLIGAGVIATASLWTVARLLHPVVRAVREGARTAADRRRGVILPPEERDLPIVLVGSGALALALPLAILIAASANASGWTAGPVLLVAAAAAATAFALFFGFGMAAACGYMAGLLGSSSSPVSGIGILGAIATALPLSRLPAGHVMSASLMTTALVVTAIVVTIASISNDNLQDLKAGRMVGATPWRQQLALMAGVVAGSAVVAPILQLLWHLYGFAGHLPRPGMDPRAAMAAPQASLVASISTGIFQHTLPWRMLLVGLALGAIVVAIEQRLRRRGRVFPALSVGIGIYLPPTVVTAIALGGVIGALAMRHARRRGTAPADDAALRMRRRGVLLASGFLVGESVAGLLCALAELVRGHVPEAGSGLATGAGLAVFLVVLTLFVRAVSRPTPPAADAG